MPARLTQEEFLKRLYKFNEHYRNGDFEVVSEYISHHEVIYTQNKYGICKVKPTTLYEGGNVTRKSAIDKTSYVINQFKEIHGDRYDYSKFVYLSDSIKSTMICEIHGEFLCNSSAHMFMKVGCVKCSNEKMGRDRVKTTEEFIKDVRKIHGDKYDYSLVDYKNSHIKIKIICTQHGVFEQKPNAHLSGKRGCKKCSTEENKFTKQSWLNSKGNLEKCIFYVCRFFKEKQEFIKIGITCRGVKDRYKDKIYKNYEYEILKSVLSEDRNFLWDLEKYIKRKFKEYKYPLDSSFPGYTECIKLEKLKEIYEEIEQFTTTFNLQR